MYTQVEESRAMVELYIVKQSEVDPWQCYVESSRVKYSLCSIMYSEQSEVEPWQSNVESSRVKQSYGRIMESLGD